MSHNTDVGISEKKGKGSHFLMERHLSEWIFKMEKWDRPINIKFIGLIFILGIACCFIRGEWTLVNFMSGVIIVAAIILVESIISIPLHFFGNRRKDKE